MEKGLNEIRNTFVFKDFKGNSPTVEQDGDAIYLLDDKKRKLPIEYASVIMDKIGHITPLCFDIAVYYKIVTGECNEHYSSSNYFHTEEQANKFVRHMKEALCKYHKEIGE